MYTQYYLFAYTIATLYGGFVVSSGILQGLCCIVVGVLLILPRGCKLESRHDLHVHALIDNIPYSAKFSRISWVSNPTKVKSTKIVF